MRIIADCEIDDFARYAAAYSENWAREQYCYIPGAPHRAYLFRVGRRTGYWIVYSVDEDAKTVNVPRFWNASRGPASFEI